MESLKNLLMWVNDNLATILSCIALICVIYVRVKKYLSLSNEEKIAIAKKEISQVMLKYVTDAELNWKEYAESGRIKRSEVIEKIFKDYPILASVTSQEELIAWMDEVIDDALDIMDEVLANTLADTEVTETV